LIRIGIGRVGSAPFVIAEAVKISPLSGGAAASATPAGPMMLQALLE
jgi:hypothetical protein